MQAGNGLLRPGLVIEGITMCTRIYNSTFPNHSSGKAYTCNMRLCNVVLLLFVLVATPLQLAKPVSTCSSSIISMLGTLGPTCLREQAMCCKHPICHASTGQDPLQILAALASVQAVHYHFLAMMSMAVLPAHCPAFLQYRCCDKCYSSEEGASTSQSLHG